MGANATLRDVIHYMRTLNMIRDVICRIKYSTCVSLIIGGVDLIRGIVPFLLSIKITNYLSLLSYRCPTLVTYSVLCLGRDVNIVNAVLLHTEACKKKAPMD